MKHIIYPLLTGLLATACQPGNDFTVNGTLGEPFTGQVYLTCIKDRLTKVDSLTLDGGTTFKFTGTMERPDYYRIMTSPRTYDASLIIEPGSEYHMNILDTHDCQVEVVRGGKEQLLLNEYEQLMMPIRETDQRLGDAYAQIERSDKQKTDSLQKLMSDNFLAREATTREFILQHPRTFTAAYLAGDLLLCTYPELKEIHEQIDTAAYTYNHNYLRFKEKYEGGKINMKRLMKGGFLTLSGAVGVTGMILTAMQNPSSAWATPPGRMITSIIENGLLIPAILLFVLLVWGLCILLTENKTD